MTVIDLEKWKAGMAPAADDMDMDAVAKGHEVLMDLSSEDAENLLMFIRFIYLADVAAGLKGGKGYQLFDEIDTLYKAAGEKMGGKGSVLMDFLPGSRPSCRFSVNQSENGAIQILMDDVSILRFKKEV